MYSPQNGTPTLTVNHKIIQALMGFNGHMPYIFESVRDVQYFCGELSFDLIYELQRWKFLSAAHKLCDRFSCLYNLQSQTVRELKLKFSDTDSIYWQNEATRSRLLWSFVRITCIFMYLYTCICTSLSRLSVCPAFLCYFY